MDTPCEFAFRTIYNGTHHPRVPSKRLRTHYIRHRGDIPDGHQLHHICWNPACTNIDHLQPLTPEAHRAAHRNRVWGLVQV